MSSRPWRDRETLYELHIQQGLQAGEIADELGCSKQTILTWCEKHGIEYDRNQGKPWFDEEKVRRLYHGEGLSINDLADRFGCSGRAIRHAMDQLGIERRPQPQDAAEGAPWRDEELVRELYVEKGLRTTEIADRFDCRSVTVRRWLERFGIEQRDSVEERARALRSEAAGFHTKKDGYERWTNKHDGEVYRVYVHRLLAVAEHGFDDVAGMEVHHENGVPWDNRPSNISLIDKAGHAQMHALERWQTNPENIGP